MQLMFENNWYIELHPNAPIVSIFYLNIQYPGVLLIYFTYYFH